MQSDPGFIPAHSRRQAFDWSLVLASQSIEATIVETDESPHWQLLVSASDYDRAVDLARGFQGEAPRAAAVISIARAVLNQKSVLVPKPPPAAKVP